MKLHLPKPLFTALLTIFATFQTLAAETTVSSAFDLSYSGKIYTLGNTSNNNTLSQYVTETTLNSEKLSWELADAQIDANSGWGGLFHQDEYNTLRLSTSGINYGYKFQELSLGGIIVDDNLEIPVAISALNSARRDITIGTDGMSCNSYFGSSFTLDNTIHNGSNSTKGVTLKGTQNWYINNSSVVTLASNHGVEIAANATWNLGAATGASGTFVIKDAVTNNGTINVNNGATLNIYGALDNNGSLTVNEGATLNLGGFVSGSGSITGNGNINIIINDGTLTNFNGILYTGADGNNTNAQHGFLKGTQTLQVFDDGSYDGKATIIANSDYSMTDGRVTYDNTDSNGVFYVNDEWTYDGTVSDGATKFQVNTAGTLKFGTGDSSTFNTSALPEIQLANGGRVWFWCNNDGTSNDTNDFQKISVLAGTGSFHLEDSNGAELQIGEISVSKGAEMQFTSRWQDSAFDIRKLTGEGRLIVTGATDGSLQKTLNVNSLAGFGGDIAVNKGIQNLTVTIHTGSEENTDIKFNSLYAESGLTSFTFYVEANTTVGNIDIAGGTVNMTAGTDLSFSSGAISSLTSGGNNAIQLGEQASLNRVTTGSVTLSGSGTYDIGSGNTDLGTVVLSSAAENGWTGTVKLSNVSGGNDANKSSLDIGDTVNDLDVDGKSTVELTGVNGYINTGDNNGSNTNGITNGITANIKLTNAADGTAAMIITNGNGDSTPGYRKAVISGTVSGTGDISYRGWNGATDRTATYQFTGDISNWSGAFKNSNKVSESGNTGSALVIFSDSATTINASVKNDGNSSAHKLSMQIGIANETETDYTINGEVIVDKLDILNNATFNSGVTVSGATTLAAGKELNLADKATISSGTMNKVKMSSSGISSAAADGSKGSMSSANVIIHELGRDASFTIEEMTLTNTTLTAGTKDTKVYLSNVSATNLALAQGKFTMDVAPSVSAGGTAVDFNARTMTYTMGVSSISKGNATLTLVADPSASASGHYGSYDLTFVLSGFQTETAFAEGSLEGLASAYGIQFGGWLGELLNNAASAVVQSATLNEGEGAAQSAASAPTVSYGAGNGSNVGSLVITITGLNVPEPASATLGLAALMMLCARRRRKA